MKTLSTAIFVRPIDNEILWILNGCNAFSYRLILSQKSEFVWASKNELKKKHIFCEIELCEWCEIKTVVTIMSIKRKKNQEYT